MFPPRAVSRQRPLLFTDDQRRNSPTTQTRAPLKIGKSLAKSRLGNASMFSTPAPSRETSIMDVDQEDDAHMQSLDEPSSDAISVGSTAFQHSSEVLDSQKGATFAASSEFKARFLETFPVEVQKAMGVGDAWKYTYIGGFEQSTGYAWMASALNVFVWRHNRNGQIAPTCHIFPSPPSKPPSPPHVTLLPMMTMKEPGLILISPSGNIRFWSSVFLGLAGAERFFSATLPLSFPQMENGEIVTTVQLVTELLLPEVIAGTSRGRLFRITIGRSSENGQWSINFKEIGGRPARNGMFSIFGFGSTSIFGTGVDGDGVVGMALGAQEKDGRDLWVLSANNLAVWRISDAGGSERLICEADVVAGIQGRVLAKYTEEEEEEEKELAGAISVGVAGYAKRALALELEVLDIVLVQSTVVDPRSPGSREGSVMEEDDLESEWTPVLLFSFLPPAEHQNGSVNFWGPNEEGKRAGRERLYGTIPCYFVGVEDLSGTRSSPVKLHKPILTFDPCDILPYSDFAPGKRATSNVSRGVNIGFGVSDAPGTQKGLFVPRLVSFQAPVTLSGVDDKQFYTVFAAIFEGGLVFSTNGGAYKDHLFMKQQHPYPKSLGIGSSDQGGFGKAELVYLTTTGVLTVLIDMLRVNAVDSQSGGAKQIRSIMEQAVLFSQIKNNPFAFRLATNVDGGHLMMAATQVSQEVVESNPKLVKRSLALKSQLEERAARLSWLIGFINSNGAISRVNASVRVSLLTDAEKISAAQGIWGWYNSSSKDIDLNFKSKSVLVEAINAYVDEHPEMMEVAHKPSSRLMSPAASFAEASFVSRIGSVISLDDAPFEEDHGTIDPVRVFFKTRARDLGKLVTLFAQVVREILGSYERAKAWPTVVTEASTGVLIMLNSAIDFRKKNSGEYGLDVDKPVECPWTSETIIVDACLYLFEQCALNSKESSAPEAKEAVEGLAGVICEGFKERLAFERYRSIGQNTWRNLNEQFITTRRRIWSMLVRHGSASHAFKLAEEHGDFHALTELCYESTRRDRRSSDASRPAKYDQRALDEKIDYYLTQYKQEFAFELYQWWIDNGMAKEIFKQNSNRAGYVDKFFATRRHPRLAWLHSIGKGQLTAASSTLQQLYGAEDLLIPAKFMLSVGKLSELAATTDDGDDRDIDDVITFYDDGLDFVSVQQKLGQDLLQILIDHSATTGNVKAQADVITKRATSNLVGRPANVSLFKKLVQLLIEGHKLDFEDTLDVLTLKENKEDPYDFGLALHLITQTGSIPQSRLEIALRTVWRRIYIRDDWTDLLDTRSYTDAQVTARLRGTALFAVLRELHTGPISTFAQPETLIKSPREALQIPTAEEMMERFVGQPEEEVELLHGDLGKERGILEQYVGVLEDAGLCREVMRLEEAEREVEQDGLSGQPLRGNSLGIDLEMS